MPKPLSLRGQSRTKARDALAGESARDPAAELARGADQHYEVPGSAVTDVQREMQQRQEAEDDAELVE